MGRRETQQTPMWLSGTELARSPGHRFYEKLNETYRKRAVFAVPIDAQRVASMVPGSAERADLPRHALEILSQCTPFRTIDEHALQIADASKLPPGAHVEIARILRGLAHKGYLVPKSALTRAGEQLASTSAASIEAVCIATRDRPRAAQRCIRSYAANLREHQRQVRWTVLDSSEHPDACRRTREELEVLARDGLRVDYATCQDKARFAEALAAEANVDPALVRFAFFDVEGLGHDTGANRNALLLAHAGELLLSVDDDTVCELRRAPDSRSEAFELASFRMPHARLFKDLAEARASLNTAAESVLGAHEELLGRTLGECLLGRRPQGVVADELFDGTLDVILSGQARVAATVGGFWGDCATTSIAFYLFGAGPRPDELPTEEAAYRELIASRLVLRAPPCTTAAQRTNIMAANLGVDLRELTPPFFPTRRASDLVFGTLLSHCFEGRFSGLLPLAAGHLPVESRSADPDGLWGTAKPKLATTVSNAIQLVPIDLAPAGAPRLRLLGRHLTELASLPWKEFERPLLRRAWLDVSGTLHLVQKRLASADRSCPWARDARAYIAALSASLGDADLIVPHSLRENRSLSDARALMQRLIGRFGGLLQAWPDLFAAAERLRAREVPFAQPLRNTV